MEKTKEKINKKHTLRKDTVVETDTRFVVTKWHCVILPSIYITNYMVRAAQSLATTQVSVVSHQQEKGSL